MELDQSNDSNASLICKHFHKHSPKEYLIKY